MTELLHPTTHTKGTLVKNTSAVLHGVHDLRIEDRDVPEPGPGEVLVRVAAVGICGSDVHYYEHGRIGDFVVDAPMVIGHESAGHIVAAGAGVDAARIGELVAMEPGVPDRTCVQCLRGRYNLCEQMRFFATPPIDGSISRFVTIDAAFAHPAPEGLTPELAAMAEPVSVGVWACRKAEVSVGDRVLVTGAGPVGLFAAQVARAFGAAEVLVADISEQRLAVVADHGLETADSRSLPDRRFDVLLECSGAAPAVTGGLLHLAPAGRAVLVGMGGDSVSIPVSAVQNRELRIAGIFRYADCYPDAIRLISSGAVDAARAITHRFALEQTEEALTIARRDPTAMKPVVLT